MGQGPLIHRASFRAMVEDHCRLYLLLAERDLETAEKCVRRFEEQVNALAELMPFDEATVFLRYIDSERTAAFQAFNDDPNMLRSRLGLDGLAGRDPVRDRPQIVMLFRAIRRSAMRRPTSAGLSPSAANSRR
jgi:hypothetical protein